MKVALQEKSTLAEAVADLIEELHHKFSGIKTQSIIPYEDEDFAIEVTIPTAYNAESVEKECNEKCIELEDKYDVYILAKVVSE